MQKALGIIYSEHRSLSAVLSGLKSLAQLASDPQVQPDFAVLHDDLLHRRVPGAHASSQRG